MSRSNDPTALERLIQPLPAEIKASVLQAWKNEDIPHDEEDSVYRLMILLTLYARYYQQIPQQIAEAETRLTRLMEANQIKFEQTWLMQVDTIRATNQHLENLSSHFKKVEGVMAEKPQSLRLQFEKELMGLLFDTQKQCKQIQTEMADYWKRTKEDQEGVIMHQHMIFFAVGLILGLAFMGLILGGWHHA